MKKMPIIAIVLLLLVLLASNSMYTVATRIQLK